MSGEREKLVECMARAMCAHEEFNPDDTQNGVPVWRMWIDQTVAALLALEASGVRLAPVEATEEMQLAGYKALVPVFEDERCEPNPRDWGDAYTAMLAASPYAPEQKDETK